MPAERLLPGWKQRWCFQARCKEPSPVAQELGNPRFPIRLGLHLSVRARSSSDHKATTISEMRTALSGVGLRSRADLGCRSPLHGKLNADGPIG